MKWNLFHQNAIFLHWKEPKYWNSMPAVPVISELAISETHAGLGPVFGRQLAVEIRSNDRRATPGRAGADFFVSVAWGTERFEFAVEAKVRSAPRVLDEALATKSIALTAKLGLADDTLPRADGKLTLKTGAKVLTNEGDPYAQECKM
jgi:hypothetical protein